MNARIATIGAAAFVLAAAAASTGWYTLRTNEPALESAAEEPLPIPPVPPRIGEGADYDRCLGMLDPDPEGAVTFATAWEATGGGATATHCLALATIATGEPDHGAAMLEKLATASAAPPATRASMLDQATQAWLMAGDVDRAVASATAALALSPDDPDLLIDRAIATGNLDHFADAIADLTRALAIDPRRPDALTLRAAGHRQTNHLDLAQSDIDAALRIDPDQPEALLERGILRQRRNDPAGARQDWQRAAQLAPDSSTADLAQQNLALLDAGPAH